MPPCRHPDAHPPIVERATFDAVQALLAARATAPRERKSKAGHAALKGLIFDAEGRPMSPTLSYGRAGRAYRYYVSSPLQKGGRGPGRRHAEACAGSEC